MKAVDLRPGDVVVASTGGPSVGAIGTMVFVVVALLGVGVYFGLAKVNTLDEEAARATKELEAARAATAEAQREYAELGVSNEIDYGAIASTLEGQLTKLLGKRYDFFRLQAEIASATPDTAQITMLALGGEGSGEGTAGTVTLEGIAETREDIAAFAQQLNASPLVRGAEIGKTSITEDVDGREYISFDLSAEMVSSDPATASPNNSLVSNKAGAAQGVSLDPSPDYARQQAARKRNAPGPLEVAAREAGGA